MDFFSEKARLVLTFFENPLFLAASTSFVCAQLIKATLTLTTLKGADMRAAVEALLWRTGGMPSSHAATVSALAAAAAAQEGPGSNLFVVTFFFAMVVLRDAVGVRRSSGLQAKLLNTLAQKLSEDTGAEFTLVKEIQGHTPREVLAGIVLGIAVASAYAFL